MGAGLFSKVALDGDGAVGERGGLESLDGSAADQGGADYDEQDQEERGQPGVEGCPGPGEGRGVGLLLGFVGRFTGSDRRQVRRCSYQRVIGAFAYLLSERRGRRGRVFACAGGFGGSGLIVIRFFGSRDRLGL